MSQGMIATTHPLAVEEGASVLAAGGSAVDAAVAAAAVLCVVEPMSVSPAGDLFAMVWEPAQARPTGLTAVGWAGSRAGSIELQGGSLDGASAVTVPGAIGGWRALLERYGAVDRARVLCPAIRAAKDGFQVTSSIAEMWAAGAPRLGGEAARVFSRDGRWPVSGDEVVNPQLGSFLETLVDRGFGWFYGPEMSESIVEALGPNGLLEPEDLQEWLGPEWVEPLMASYRGFDVFEMPPPGQGLTVLQAIEMYESLEVPPADRQHALVECMKLAFEDASRFVCDPTFGLAAEGIMLDPDRVERNASQVSLQSARATITPGTSDTVYVAAVDADGMACSLIQSIYMSFGSGIVIPGTGVLLHNRGANFRLDPIHPNRLEARKRPLHTILPAMIGRDGLFYGNLGVVGAFMQPQGQLQILHHLIENSYSAGRALASPRWRILGDARLGLEGDFDPDAARHLDQKGHALEPLETLDAGAAQVIIRTEEGLVGASEPRRDGRVQAV